MPNSPIITEVWTPEDARLLAALAAKHATYPAGDPGMRPGKLRRRLALMAFGAILAGTGIGFFAMPEAHADEPASGCQVDNWGFLGLTQKRTICDGDIHADGSWNRHRVIWTPAHNVPLTTNCYGGSYSMSCSTSGGYFQPYTESDDELYPVTPDTVLPDEPGHLVGGAIGGVYRA